MIESENSTILPLSSPFPPDSSCRVSFPLICHQQSSGEELPTPPDHRGVVYSSILHNLSPGNSLLGAGTSMLLNVSIVDYYWWTIIVDDYLWTIIVYYYLWMIIVDYYSWTIIVGYHWWHIWGFSCVMHQRSCTRGKLFCKRNNHPYELCSSLGCLSDMEIEHQWMILENDFSSVAACMWSVFCHAELFIYFSTWRFRAWFIFLQNIIANKKKCEHTLKKD